MPQILPKKSSLELHVTALQGPLALVFARYMQVTPITRLNGLTPEELIVLVRSVPLPTDVALAAVEMGWLWEAGAGMEYCRSFLTKLVANEQLARFYLMLSDLASGVTKLETHKDMRSLQEA
jgi:hypothetical protein